MRCGSKFNLGQVSNYQDGHQVDTAMMYNVTAVMHVSKSKYVQVFRNPR